VRILVTGGFGFLGMHLAEQLAQDPDNRLHVVDNLSSSPLPIEALLHELGPPANLTYSVEDAQHACRELAHERFDQIYHLASMVGPAGILAFGGTIASSILSQMMAVAELALRHDAKLVFVSSSEVYGGGDNGYCSEQTPKAVPAKITPRLEYALGKLAAETALVNLCAVKGLRACIVRPFNVAGPRQSGRGGFVLPRFVGQALDGLDLTVFGSGEQLRAFTHVRDIARGLVATMQRGRTGEVYNLGKPENRCSIGELAREVIEITGSSSAIAHVDPSTIHGPLFADAADKFPDATKARNELGWEPRLGRLETIRDSVEYMRRLPRPLFEHLRGF